MTSIPECLVPRATPARLQFLSVRRRPPARVDPLVVSIPKHMDPNGELLYLD